MVGCIIMEKPSFLYLSVDDDADKETDKYIKNTYPSIKVYINPEIKYDIKYYIAHRANYNGYSINENTIKKIKYCIDSGYDVEIDVWYKDNKFLLGHDVGLEEINLKFIFLYADKLWIHCKNLECYERLYNISNEYKKLNIFYHTNDDIVLTTKGYIWTYPGRYQMINSILVLPETFDYSLKNVVGICSDNVEYFKKILEIK